MYLLPLKPHILQDETKNLIDGVVRRLEGIFNNDNFSNH